MELFWKKRIYSMIDNCPFHLNKQVIDQCVLATMTFEEGILSALLTQRGRNIVRTDNTEREEYCPYS